MVGYFVNIVDATLEMLANGEIDRRGVVAPKGGVDLDRFFQRLGQNAVRPAGSNRSPFFRVMVEFDQR